MSGCVEYNERLALLVLGELAPADAAAVTAHLQRCAGCRRERDELAAAAALLSEPLDEHPGELDQLRISNEYYRRLAEEHRGRGRETAWMRVAAAAALIVVGIGLGARLPPLRRSADPNPPAQFATVGSPPLTSDEFASRRLTPEGFRLIARGRQAEGGH